MSQLMGRSTYVISMRKPSADSYSPVLNPWNSVPTVDFDKPPVTYYLNFYTHLCRNQHDVRGRVSGQASGHLVAVHKLI